MTDLPVIVSASNELLRLEDGRQLIDFMSGNGAVIMGHGNPQIAAQLKEQVDAAWSLGQRQHPAFFRAKNVMESMIPAPYSLQAFYSTGMEAIEFTLRISAVHTKRNAYCAFAQSMHGKSLACSSLGWENSFQLNNVHIINTNKSEDETLADIEKLFSTKKIAAFFIELIQGSAGGQKWTKIFYQQILALCKRYQVISIADEILTGFYRAGTLSKSLEWNLTPDIIVFGKAIGNGFPVSAVMTLPHLHIDNRMLPRSTFSENPLACTAVFATLECMQEQNISALIEHVSGQIKQALGKMSAHQIQISGEGLLWFLTAESPELVRNIWMSTLRNGTLTSCAGKSMRLMPAATIKDNYLQKGLSDLRYALEENL